MEDEMGQNEIKETQDGRRVINLAPKLKTRLHRRERECGKAAAAAVSSSLALGANEDYLFSVCHELKCSIPY